MDSSNSASSAAASARAVWAACTSSSSSAIPRAFSNSMAENFSELSGALSSGGRGASSLASFVSKLLPNRSLRVVFLKKAVVKFPPSIATSPNILFWVAFLRMFSSTVS
uniref:Uncharacterized protein n=1 Tax=Ixodes ricinus TaxID=34613 RepID=A0A6B0UIA7_IXORI